MTSFHGRPLLATSSDAGRYVERDADRSVQRAIDQGSNVLVTGARGAGITSLLNRAEAQLGDRAALLNAAAATSADELMEALTERLGGTIPTSPGQLRSRLTAPSSLTFLRRQVERRGATPEAPQAVLLDGPVPASVAHDLFGAQRDHLWSLPMQWTVAVPVDQVAAYLTPPADVFFDDVVELGTLSDDECAAVLSRRGGNALPPSRRAEVVRLSDGTPRHLLALARRALGDPDSSLDADPSGAVSALSPNARMLWSALKGRAGVTANDPDLLRQLNWSPSTLRRTLGELEAAEMVGSSRGTGEGPGRRAYVYRPVASTA